MGISVVMEAYILITRSIFKNWVPFIITLYSRSWQIMIHGSTPTCSLKPAFINKSFIGTQHGHLFTFSLQLLSHYNGRVKYLQSLKYLLSGHLQKKKKKKNSLLNSAPNSYKTLSNNKIHSLYELF